MKTKMKGKGKAIVGIVLAAIMLASIFAAIVVLPVSAYDPRYGPPSFPEIQTPPDLIGTPRYKSTLESTTPKFNYFSQPKSISTWKPLKLTTPKFNYFSQPKSISTWKPLELTTPKIDYFSQPKSISTWKPLELTTPKIDYFSQPKSISTWKPEWWSKNVPFTPKDMNTLQKRYDNIYKQPLQWHSSYKPISTYTSYTPMRTHTSYTPMRTNFNSFQN